MVDALHDLPAEPCDLAQRRAALDPGRSFIVQAPAGSGKTELLTQRYLRLLAEVRQPEEILAITFTRKAAAEMRLRVLAALEAVATPEPPTESHKQATWELGRVARARDAEEGWALAAHPARLRITTIDALNHELAAALPILSRTGSSLQVATEFPPLYAAAALQVLGHLGADADPYAVSVETVMRYLDNQAGAFVELIADLLARRDHWLDLGLLAQTEIELRQSLEQALARVTDERLAKLGALFPLGERFELVDLALYAAGHIADPEHPLRRYGPLTTFPGEGSESLAGWRVLACLLLTDKGAWRKTVNVRQGFPPADKARVNRMKELLAALSEHDASLLGELAIRLQEARQIPAPGGAYSPSQWAALAALLEVLKLAVAELDVVFGERGEVDHVAATLAARRALGTADAPTDLALRLDRRLQHLLVDEFQDTSRSQVELLRLLTAGWMPGDGRSLFLVGDPMQSIYRFRDADVGLYLRLQRDGLGHLALESLRLAVNFRSTAAIVEWLNQVFSDVLPKVEDPERGAVTYTASIAGGRKAVPTAGVPAVQIHALIGEGDTARAAEARRVAELVDLTRRERPDARIAVLVTGRAHLKRTLEELIRRGTPFTAVEIDRLASRSGVQDLMALTRALVHPGDRTAWLAVLRAPWCGLTLVDLHALTAEITRRGRQPPTVREQLGDEARLAALTEPGRLRVLRLRSVLEAALAERGRHPLRDWVERAWHALGGPATLASATDLDDAEAYLTRLEKIEEGGDLSDVARLEQQMAELFAMPRHAGSTAEGGSLEVMTLHKAKGLEFDVVIVPGLDRIPRTDDEPLLRWLDVPLKEAGPSLLVAPKASPGEANPYFAWLQKIESERASFERGRQLYVAATRAIHTLHLLGCAPAEGGIVGKPASTSLLSLLWPRVEADFAAAAASTSPVTPGDAPSVTTAAPRGIELRALPAAWTAPAPPEGVAIQPLPTAVQAAAPLVFDWASETSRHVGTLVHRALERLAALPPAERRTVAVTRDLPGQLARLGVPQDRRAAAATRVAAALDRVLDDERGRWLLAGPELHREAHSEFALSGVDDRRLVNVIIDRMLLDRDGVRWVVDFKTSTHEGAGLDLFLASEEARYRPQLERYARLLHALYPDAPVRMALYFPLLRVWREVPSTREPPMPPAPPAAGGGGQYPLFP